MPFRRRHAFSAVADDAFAMPRRHADTPPPRHASAQWMLRRAIRFAIDVTLLLPQR